MCAVACGATSVGAQPRADVSLVPGRSFAKIFPCGVHSGVTSCSRIFFSFVYSVSERYLGAAVALWTRRLPVLRNSLRCFMALECLQTVLPARVCARAAEISSSACVCRRQPLPRACRLRVDCTYLQRRAMPWLRGVACDSGSLAVGGRTKTQSQFQWTVQRQARYSVSTWRRSFFRGGDDLRAVVVHVVIRSCRSESP